MIEDTIKKIESKIETANSITKESKTELLDLLQRLETEIVKLSQSKSEHAESVAGFIERSTHEATRREKNPELLELSLAGLVASVKGFEVSHPRLVADINAICTTLANMGI
ncbi:MAG: DUF4404 family protein [Bacteroidota bacterium]